MLADAKPVSVVNTSGGSGEARESISDTPESKTQRDSRGGGNSWVFAFRVEPPNNQTILARSGGSIFFAAYSRLLDRWYMIYPGGSEQIEQPEMWWCDEEWAKTHQRDLAPPPVQRIRKSKRPQQMQLL